MYTSSTINIDRIRPVVAAQKIYQAAIANREETESSRKVSSEVVDLLKKYNLFRLGLPKHLGGWENDPIEVLNVYEILSSAEGSVGWVTWNNHLACTFGRFLDEKSMDEVYKNFSHGYANSARPEGVAKIVPGGYMVSGRWTLVSACELADWFVLRCLVTGKGLPDELGPGAKLKLFFIPKEKIEIIDTWSVGGLRGTGSHDVEIKDTFVSEKYAIGFDSPVALNNAYSRLPIGCMNAAGCASMALGLLKGALDELTHICLERVTPGKNPDLRDRPTVQVAVAKAQSVLKSNRLALHNSVSVLWNESMNNNDFSDEQLADVWSASCEAASSARAMVSEIYAVAGTASLYTKNRIERIHRDIYAVLQHGIVQPHWMNQAGMAYLGIKPNGAMFRI